MALSVTSAVHTEHARRLLSFTQDAALVGLYAVFAAVYVRDALDGHLVAAPFAVEQGVLVAIFLTRRRSFVTSTLTRDWIFATVGGFLPLALRPTNGSMETLQWAGFAIQISGLSLACLAFLYLGRSFGIVAANRGLKVDGPYRFVRHPIYLCHTITMSGFIAANFGWVNLTIVAAAMICQVMRMGAEERVLTHTDEYALYRARVRWRLVPGLY
jgi:protein-S-isoprenylcysteine O-methyltransferase Ste14